MAVSIYKTVLQCMMVERTLSLPNFKELCQNSAGSSTIDVDLVVSKINDSIKDFRQKLSPTTCELTGEKMYVLISTADHPDIKSSLPPEQVDYFYHLMDSIVSNSGSLDLISALNMASTVTKGKVTMADAEKILLSFTKLRLLIFKNEYFYLSPLTIAELESFIIEKYNAESCFLCKKVVIYGDMCHNCSVCFHIYCLNQFNKRGQHRCPGCKCLREPAQESDSSSG